MAPPFFKTYRPGDERQIEPPDPATLDTAVDWLGALARYHRYSVVGLENVPRDGRALMVSTHSFSVIDILLLARAIWIRDRRILRGLTDHSMFEIPLVRDLFATLGIIDGTQENGLALLESGQLACCMPGGGLEWVRPTAKARKLRWGDHRGYARLAIRAQAPIIATACPTADYLYFLPVDGWQVGQMLQRWLGTSRVWPVALALGLGPLPFPVKLTSHVAPAIVPDVPPEAADDPSAVEALDARVRAAVAELLAR